MTARTLLRQNVTAIWLGLALVTCVSWWLGTEHGTSHTIATIGVIVIGFTKVQFIGLYFMELKGAPIALLVLFEIYAVVVPAALIVMYLVM
jgi:hypothetical protein